MLISGSNVSGYEYGPAELVLCVQFAAIETYCCHSERRVVLEGHFASPMAAAVGHMQKASEYLDAKRLDQALQEAQKAVALAPTSVKRKSRSAMYRKLWAKPTRPPALLQTSAATCANGCSRIPSRLGGAAPRQARKEVTPQLSHRTTFSRAKDNS